MEGGTLAWQLSSIRKTHDPDEVQTEYFNPEHDHFRTRIVPILQQLPVAEVARATGLSDRTVKRARAGKGTPSGGKREFILTRA